MGWFSKKEAPPEEKIQAGSGSGLRLFIQKMDVAGVKASLAAGASPDGAPEDDISPLVMVAAGFTGSLPIHRKSQKAIMMLLLDAGANPRWGGRDGQSPFEVAIRKGWIDVVEKMVSKGHPLEAIDGSGFTALHLVFNPVDYKGTPLLPMVTKLLELGADPNGEGKINRSALLMAAQQFETLKSAEDYKETVRTLVAVGAKIDPGAIENLQELLEKADLVEIVRI
jgi:ankyrin repeat protein